MIKLKRLLKESINGEELVVSGLKKVFANARDTGGKPISYDQIESVGLGYIKDVSTAQKVAYQSAVQLASQFGYSDDIEHEQFVKGEETSVNEAPNKQQDAVMQYLMIIAQMPSDQQPPLKVWKYIVENASIALQHYMTPRFGVNEKKS